jgi:hypothetical protein
LARDNSEKPHLPACREYSLDDDWLAESAKKRKISELRRINGDKIRVGENIFFGCTFIIIN